MALSFFARCHWGLLSCHFSILGVFSEFWHDYANFCASFWCLLHIKSTVIITWLKSNLLDQKKKSEHKMSSKTRRSSQRSRACQFYNMPLSCIIDRLITTCASGGKIQCINVIHTFSKRLTVTAIYVCMYVCPTIKVQFSFLILFTKYTSCSSTRPFTTQAITSKDKKLSDHTCISLAMQKCKSPVGRRQNSNP